MLSVADIHAEPKDDLCASNKDLCHTICDQSVVLCTG